MSTTNRFSSQELISQLIGMAQQGFSGSVRHLDPAGSPLLTWILAGGRVVDIVTPRASSLLTTTLEDSPTIRDRDRKRLIKQAQAENRDLGELIVEQGLLADDEIGTRLLSGIDERMAILLVDESAQFDWCIAPPAATTAELVALLRGDSREVCGIADALQIELVVDDLLIGACRRIGQWQRIREQIPAFKDVYYATPQTFALIQQPDEYPTEVAVVSMLDGERDVMEVIDTIDLDPFAGLDALYRLQAEGSIALINPVQLFQQGCELEKAGALDRALRRLERAEQRGLDDFDLGFRLAELYAQRGQNGEAIRHYLAFAEKCASQFRIEDTMLACSRVIELDPGNMAIRERYLSLLTKSRRNAEAFVQAIDLSRRYLELGDEKRALGAFDAVLELEEPSEGVLQAYLDCCRQTRNAAGVADAERRLAALYTTREQSEKALELFQNSFAQGNDTPELRAKLVELHLAAGNVDTALEHLSALSSDAEWQPGSASDEARALYQHLVERFPQRSEFTSWLVDDARRRGDRNGTAMALASHRDGLLASGDVDGAFRAAEKLVELCPLDVDARRNAAQLAQRNNATASARTHLEQLLLTLQEKQADSDVICAVLDELIHVDPLSLRGRRELRELGSHLSPEHMRRVDIEIALLEMASGHADATKELSSRLGADRYLVDALNFVAACLGRDSGERASSIDAYHRCAKAASERRDPVMLKECLAALRQLTPEDPQLDRYQATLGELERPAATSGAGMTRAPRTLPGNSVSGITARLRNMKTGASGTAEPKSTAPAATQANALDAVARLKSLKGGVAARSANEGQGVPLSSGITGVEKLGVLREAASNDCAPTSSAPPPKTRGVTLGGPAAALKALRNAGSTESSAETPVSSNAAATEELAEVEHPKPKATKALGGAASKLSALRKSGD